MEPNCCPYCARELPDKTVIRMYKRYCAGQRKPKLAGKLKQVPPTESDREWARDEVRRIEAAKMKAEPHYEFGDF